MPLTAAERTLLDDWLAGDAPVSPASASPDARAEFLRLAAEYFDRPVRWRWHVLSAAMDRHDRYMVEIAAATGRAQSDFGRARGHWSDCATHNEPALPAGPCDCGAKVCAELDDDGA